MIFYDHYPSTYKRILKPGHIVAVSIILFINLFVLIPTAILMYTTITNVSYLAMTISIIIIDRDDEGPKSHQPSCSEFKAAITESPSEVLPRS